MYTAVMQNCAKLLYIFLFKKEIWIVDNYTVLQLELGLQMTDVEHLSKILFFWLLCSSEF